MSVTIEEETETENAYIIKGCRNNMQATRTLPPTPPKKDMKVCGKEHARELGAYVKVVLKWILGERICVLAKWVEIT